jgi:hypothetical protein
LNFRPDFEVEVQYCEENEWEKFYSQSFKNAQRLAKVMCEAADGLLPEASLNANLNKDVFDVLLQNVRATSAKCI